MTHRIVTLVLVVASIVCGIVVSNARGQQQESGVGTTSRPYAEKQTGLTFPQQIGKLTLDQPHEFSEKRLGVGIRYRRDKALTIDTFIYDNGLAKISPDLKSEEVQAQLDEATRNIQQSFPGLTIESRELVRLSDDANAPSAHKLLCAVGSADQRLGTCLYLFAYNNHFVKIRTTWAGNPKDGVPQELNEYVRWLGHSIVEATR
jgi:hypothetical protein